MSGSPKATTAPGGRACGSHPRRLSSGSSAPGPLPTPSLGLKSAAPEPARECGEARGPGRSPDASSRGRGACAGARSGIPAAASGSALGRVARAVGTRRGAASVWRPHRTLPPARPGAEGGPPLYLQKEAVPERARRQGHRGAGQTGGSWPPPGAALRGRRRGRGQRGAASEPNACRCDRFARDRARGIRGNGRPRHLPGPQPSEVLLCAARAEIQAAGKEPAPLGAQDPELGRGKRLVPFPMWRWPGRMGPRVPEAALWSGTRLPSGRRPSRGSGGPDCGQWSESLAASSPSATALRRHQVTETCALFRM